ncbi:glycosyltransferase family 4 protein [Polynucleobacter sphagniphilus]|uniref:glycosyltransferase family 4 protein n=1 Tax=Polynucleobacter sphagniphilus TaxID=1743169 RepID=UPI00240677CE|nr:glycosyltransferase family 4 protein [Polynucleobacter sphagniphilus]MDF9787578.1 glycosyltransferase involved in cell wall biosynthesis [Polynucleobacter sphagniphilus]
MSDSTQHHSATSDVTIVYPSIGYTGGVERVMAEVLKFLFNNNYQIQVICSEIDDSLRPLCSKVHIIPIHKSNHLLWDMFHTAHWMLQAGRQAKLANKLKSRIISAPCALFTADLVMAGSCHIAAQFERLKRGSFKWLLNPRHWFYIFCEASIFLRNQSQILVPSKRTKSEIDCFYSPAKNRIHVVPHGVDSSIFYPADGSKTEIRTSIGLPEDAVIFLTVTNEIKRKGCLNALEALKLIEQNGVKFHYLVVGRDDSSELLSKARDLGLGSVVSAMPGVHGAELVRLFQASDLFVLPTEYESFGLVGIEALACGLPVLCTKVGGLEDYVTNGQDGIFVERTSADIARGLKYFFSLAPDAKRDMRDLAIEKSRVYQWSEVLQPILSILNK